MMNKTNMHQRKNNLNYFDSHPSEIKNEIIRMYKEIYSEHTMSQTMGHFLQSLRDVTGTIKDYKVALNLDKGVIHVVYWMFYSTENMTFNIRRRG